MKKLIIFSLMLMIYGCSTSLPDKAYYQLSSDFSDTNLLHPSKVTDVILIENIQIANYLDKTGIVYQTNDIEYSTANNNLWLTPLSDQIKQRLMHDLSILLPNYLITEQPIGHTKVTLKLYIDRFHGLYTGDAVIQGRWLISTSKEVITKHFDYTMRLTEDGYPALVKMLSQGWQEEELDLIKKVKF